MHQALPRFWENKVYLSCLRNYSYTPYLGEKEYTILKLKVKPSMLHTAKMLQEG